MATAPAEGARLSLQSAESHHEAASLLGGSGFFGPAIALRILAAEESVKAWVYLSQATKHELPPQLVRNLLRDHTTRHVMAGLEAVLTSRAEALLDSSSGPGDTVVETNAEAANLLQELMQPLVPLLRDATEAVLDGADVSPESSWWSRANDLKNAGLYVDRIGGSYVAPARFTEEDFEEASRFTLDFSNRAEELLSPWVRLAERDPDRFRRVVDQIIAPVVIALSPLW